MGDHVMMRRGFYRRAELEYSKRDRTIDSRIRASCRRDGFPVPIRRSCNGNRRITPTMDPRRHRPEQAHAVVRVGLHCTRNDIHDAHRRTRRLTRN